MNVIGVDMGTKDETVIVVQSSSGKVEKVFRIPTGKINDRDKEDIRKAAWELGYSIGLYPCKEQGIEATKHDVKELESQRGMPPLHGYPDGD